MTVAELLSDESKWCKFAPARDESGLACRIDDGVSWCLVGAIRKCYSKAGDRIDAEDKMRKILKCRPSDFNDASGTNFQSIRRVIEAAGI